MPVAAASPRAGIPGNIPSDRLLPLVEDGVIEKAATGEGAKGLAYRLTEKARALTAGHDRHPRLEIERGDGHQGRKAGKAREGALARTR